MTGNLDWKCAFITGGAGGIGKGLAELFLKKGKKVIIAGRTESKLQKTASELKVDYVVIDTADIASLPSVIESAIKKHPEIDCVVNNAGIQLLLDYDKSDPTSIIKDAEAEIDTNIRGVVHSCGLFLPHLKTKKSSCIINITSGLAYNPKADVPVYCATKAFIRSYTLSLRFQLAPLGVRVVEIAPPLVESDLHRTHADPNAYTKEKTGGMALTMDEFIEQIEQGMDQGLDECGAGFSKTFIKKAHDAYGEWFEKVNKR